MKANLVLVYDYEEYHIKDIDVEKLYTGKMSRLRFNIDKDHYNLGINTTIDINFDMGLGYDPLIICYLDDRVELYAGEDENEKIEDISTFFGKYRIEPTKDTFIFDLPF